MDIIGELRTALSRLAQRNTEGIRALRGERLPRGVLAEENPMGTNQVDPLRVQTFATGFDGTVTIVPFTWDLSEWDTDTWTG